MPSAVGLPLVQPPLLASPLPVRRPSARSAASTLVYDVNFTAAGTPTAAGYTFARTGTAWDATGVSYASGVPRITSAGLLLEGARTNLCLRSQEFDNASWTKTSSSVTANSLLAPDGALTADTYTESASGASLRPASAITTVAGTTYTASIFLKRGNCDWARFLVGDSTAFTNGCRLWVNLATGVLGINTVAGTGATFTSASVTASGSSWYRVTLTFSYASSTTLYVGVFSASANNSTTRADVGGGAGIGGYVYVWQAQVEAGAFASSPIVTTTAVTRNGSTCVATRAGGSLVQGTVVIEATTAAGNTTSTWARLWEVNDGTSNTRITLLRDPSGGLWFAVLAGGVSQVSSSPGTVLANLTTFKTAFAWSSDRYAISVDGAAVSAAAAATVPSGLVGERLGVDADAGSSWHGHIRRVTRYSVVWPDAALRTGSS